MSVISFCLNGICEGLKRAKFTIIIIHNSAVLGQVYVYWIKVVLTARSICRRWQGRRNEIKMEGVMNFLGDRKAQSFY